MISQDFYDQLQVSEAGKQYLTLIDSCKDRALIPEPCYEIHHIHPTKMGGSNSRDNKVKLSVFEHCQAHALLAQAIPCYKTLQPLTRMSCGQVQKLSDLEQVKLDELYQWSKLREKALHHPKSPEHVEKNRASYLGKKLSPEQIERRTAHRVGTVTVTDGIDTKYIRVEELEQWKDKGWTRGIGQIRRDKLIKSHTGKSGELSASTGRVAMHLGDKEYKVKPEDIEARLAEGYVLGRAEKFKEQYNKSMKGKTNVGKVRINKDGVGKLVSKDNMQSYLDQGWKLGLAKHI